jgi:hypothetical protein
MHRRNEIDWALSNMTPKAVPDAPLGLLARQCQADADVEAAAAIAAPTNIAIRKRTMITLPDIYARNSRLSQGAVALSQSCLPANRDCRLARYRACAQPAPNSAIRPASTVNRNALSICILPLLGGVPAAVVLIIVASRTSQCFRDGTRRLTEAVTCQCAASEYPHPGQLLSCLLVVVTAVVIAAPVRPTRGATSDTCV